MDNYIGPAVSIQQLHLSYGFAASKMEVLKSLNLFMETGTIYGLLGASGCGKTSLLKCIVGILKPKKGSIQVYGNKPGTVESRIPGSGVGYMPQDLALHQELTIEEILNYFGRIHHMSKTEIKSRISFLLEFLDLPLAKRLVAQLSGGQKRRVSFAVALLHEPPLLILDEPTVGVDPILRESIWDHLLEIRLRRNTTIIITTHYIEECNKANKVGLMRNGRILVEDNPAVLLTRYNLPTLENVYLKLCHEDENKENEMDADRNNKKSILDYKNPSYSQPESEVVNLPKEKKTNVRKVFINLSPGRIMAVIIKNLIKMKRNRILLMTQFILPAITISAFCLAIGNDPHHIPIAVFNEDKNLGAKFLLQINNESITQLPVNSLDNGVDLVTYGDAVAVIHIGKNFTNSLQERLLSRNNLSGSIVQSSTIHVRLDNTKQIAFFLYQSFEDALRAFAESQLGKVSRYPQMISNLLKDGEPIYGREESSHQDFLATGIIIVIMYVTAVGLTSVSLIVDKKEGLFERSSISGVTSFETMCGYLLTQVGVVIIQVCIVLIFAFKVFGVHIEGSLFLIITLSTLQGMCGITLGFLISTICNEEKSAIMLTTLIFFPCFSYSGTLWTRLGMSNFNQKLSELLPHTLCVDAMKWIMLRGADISLDFVWLGFLSSICWIFGYVILSAIALHVRQL